MTAEVIPFYDSREDEQESSSVAIVEVDLRAAYSAGGDVIRQPRALNPKRSSHLGPLFTR
jgi:hypothetical protein